MLVIPRYSKESCSSIRPQELQIQEIKVVLWAKDNVEHYKMLGREKEEFGICSWETGDGLFEAKA